jgi:hypothetical protein
MVDQGTWGLPLRLFCCLVLATLYGCTVTVEEGEVCAEPVLEKSDNISSLYLNGKDDFVELGVRNEDDPLQLAGEPFTIAAWFRQEEGGDPYQRIIDKSDGPLARNGWALAADPETGMIHFYVHDDDGGADLASRRDLYKSGEWHFVVAVARRDRLEIWLDGELDDGSWYEEGAHTLPPRAATGLRIGNWNHEAGRAWHGWLDEVAVWNTDLPPELITALYQARGQADLSSACGAYDQADNLVGWWRMGSGARLADPTSLQWTVEDFSGSDLEGSLRPPRGPRLEVGEVP